MANFLDHSDYLRLIRSNTESVTNCLEVAEQPLHIYYSHMHQEEGDGGNFQELPENLVIQYLKVGTGTYEVNFVANLQDWDNTPNLKIVNRDMEGNVRGITVECDFFDHIPKLTIEQRKVLRSNEILNASLLMRPKKGLKLYENGCVLVQEPGHINVAKSTGGAVCWSLQDSIVSGLCNCYIRIDDTLWHRGDRNVTGDDR